MSFAGAAFAHPANAAGQCYTATARVRAGAMMVNASHVPTGAASCDACHKSTALAGSPSFRWGQPGIPRLGVSHRASDCTCLPYRGAISASWLNSAAHTPTTTRIARPATTASRASGGQSYIHPSQRRGSMQQLPRHRLRRRHDDDFQSRPDEGRNCDACHTSTASGGFTSYTMGTTGHTALGVSITSDCTTCHMGNYMSVVVKPSAHIATTPANQNCSASGCHTSFTSFAGTTYTHTTSASGQCYTCHGTGSGGAMMENATHVPTGTVSCDACHTSTVSGGFANFAMGSTGHSALGITSASNCTTCHAGTYFGVMVKPSTHVTYTPATLNCSTSGCHSGFASFAGTTYNHTGVVAGSCNTCHVPGNTVSAMVENSTHVPTGTVSCDVCHTSMAAWRFCHLHDGDNGAHRPWHHQHDLDLHDMPCG